MSISPEELTAFADGQLEGEAHARVAAAIEADPELARQVAAHRALAEKLSGHFAPILDQPVPDKLTAMLTGAQDSEPEGPAEVVDFAAAKERAEAKRRLPALGSGWGWGGGAIAAALVAAIVLNTGDSAPNATYADAQLASALNTQLVAVQSTGADTRILLSFRNESGEYCRAFTQAEASGIACRDDSGWRQEAIGEGSSDSETEFRMAGSEAEILAAAQDMASDGALTAEEEVEAAANDWTD